MTTPRFFYDYATQFWFSGDASAVQAAELRLGLDRPLRDQYLSFLGGLTLGGLGTSYSGAPVTESLSSAAADDSQLEITAMMTASPRATNHQGRAVSQRGSFGVAHRFQRSGTIQEAAKMTIRDVEAILPGSSSQCLATTEAIARPQVARVAGFEEKATERHGNTLWSVECCCPKRLERPMGLCKARLGTIASASVATAPSGVDWVVEAKREL